MEWDANVDKEYCTIPHQNLGAAMQLRMRDCRFHASSCSVHSRCCAIVSLVDWDSYEYCIDDIQWKSHLCYVSRVRRWRDYQRCSPSLLIVNVDHPRGKEYTRSNANKRSCLALAGHDSCTAQPLGLLVLPPPSIVHAYPTLAPISFHASSPVVGLVITGIVVSLAYNLLWLLTAILY